MKEEFRAAAERIESNPLGRLMYGQRELFHSNLLAWFFDALPVAADATFRAYAADGEGSERRVERERGHLDLVLRWPDRAPVVIENKVFSLPQREQLEEYEAATAGWRPAPSLVLLSMSAPQFELGSWQHFRYAELAERIRASLPSQSTYEVETMRRYADLVADLDQLVAAVGVESNAEGVWLGDDLLSAISSSQMRAALQKARAQRVASYLARELRLSDQPWSSMSRATPLIEIFQPVTVDRMSARAGWQLQGAQFRRTILFEDLGLQGRDKDSHRRREEVSRRHPELFALPSSIEANRSGRKEFNHFAPDSVYQYAKVPELTMGGLIAAAQEVKRSVDNFASATPASRQS